MPLFQQNPDKLDAKALDYERRGKTAKALKYREKAARLRSGGLPMAAATAPTMYSTTPTMVTTTTTSPLTTSTLQQTSFQQGLPLQQGLQQPLQQGLPLQQGFQQPLQQGFQQPLQQGLQQPLQQGFQQPLQQGMQQPLQQGFQQGMQQPLQQGMQQPLQQGFQQPLQQGMQPGLQQQQQGFYSSRTVDQYEKNALKWEKKGNWQKAQKNREKAWRLQNPQYGAQYNAPGFYDKQNKFLGYNVPVGAPMQGQGFQQQQMGLQQQQPIGLQQQQMGQQATIHHVMPAVVESHMHAPIVEQTTRAERIVEVQPVIHREIEKPEVHVIEKHMYEQVRSTGPSTITKNAIIEETVRPRIIEEIQPVVHREVPAPFVERVEQHVTEHITQPTTMVKEVVNEQGIRPTPGMAAGGPAIGVPQQPLQQQQRRF